MEEDLFLMTMISPLVWWGGHMYAEGSGGLQVLPLGRAGLPWHQPAQAVLSQALAGAVAEVQPWGWEMAVGSPGAKQQPQGWRKLA